MKAQTDGQSHGPLGMLTAGGDETAHRTVDTAAAAAGFSAASAAVEAAAATAAAVPTV